MKNELYRRVLRAAKDSPDGETATMLVVTEEANCWIVWLRSYDTGTTALYVSMYSRDVAIEKAVLWQVADLPDEAIRVV